MWKYQIQLFLTLPFLCCSQTPPIRHPPKNYLHRYIELCTIHRKHTHTEPLTAYENQTQDVVCCMSYVPWSIWWWSHCSVPGQSTVRRWSNCSCTLWRWPSVLSLTSALVTIDLGGRERRRWTEGYLVPILARKITCQHFDWRLQSSSGWKCDNWSIQSKHRQVIFWAKVGTR